MNVKEEVRKNYPLVVVVGAVLLASSAFGMLAYRLFETERQLSEKMQYYDVQLRYLADANLNLTLLARSAVLRMYDYEKTLSDFRAQIEEVRTNCTTNMVSTNETTQHIVAGNASVQAEVRNQTQERNETGKTPGIPPGVPASLAFQYKYDCMQKLSSRIGPYVCLRAECELRYAGWWEEACKCWETFTKEDKEKC